MTPIKKERGPASGRASGASGTPFQVGLLGHGTVGSAFAELLPARAAQVEAITGLRPEIGRAHV